MCFFFRLILLLVAFFHLSLRIHSCVGSRLLGCSARLVIVRMVFSSNDSLFFVLSFRFSMFASDPFVWSSILCQTPRILVQPPASQPVSHPVDAVLFYELYSFVIIWMNNEYRMTVRVWLSFWQLFGIALAKINKRQMFRNGQQIANTPTLNCEKKAPETCLKRWSLLDAVVIGAIAVVVVIQSFAANRNLICNEIRSKVPLRAMERQATDFCTNSPANSKRSFSLCCLPLHRHRFNVIVFFLLLFASIFVTTRTTVVWATCNAQRPVRFAHDRWQNDVMRFLLGHILAGFHFDAKDYVHLFMKMRLQRKALHNSIETFHRVCISNRTALDRRCWITVIRMIVSLWVRAPSA